MKENLRKAIEAGAQLTTHRCGTITVTMTEAQLDELLTRFEPKREYSESGRILLALFGKRPR